MAKDSCPPTMFDMHCKEEFQDIKGSLKRIETKLMGNGDEGMCTTVAKLQDKMKSISRAMWVLFVALVGAVVAWVKSLLTGE